jgi:hypothetical protein
MRVWELDLSTRRPSRDLFAQGSTFTEQNYQWALVPVPVSTRSATTPWHMRTNCGPVEFRWR